MDLSRCQQRKGRIIKHLNDSLKAGTCVSRQQVKYFYLQGERHKSGEMLQDALK